MYPGHDGRAGCAALFIAPSARLSFHYNAFLSHARAHLPRYAVPVFLRISSSIAPMHNNKQNKVPLRNDGIDIRKIRERARKEGKREEGVDKVLFCPHALGHPKIEGMEEEGFVEFTVEDWDGMRAGVAKL
jgi:hypothetical protein